MAFYNELNATLNQTNDGQEAVVTVTGALSSNYSAIVLIDLTVTRSDGTTTTGTDHFFLSRTYPATGEGSWSGSDIFNIPIYPVVGTNDTLNTPTAFASYYISTPETP